MTCINLGATATRKAGSGKIKAAHSCRLFPVLNRLISRCDSYFCHGPTRRHRHMLVCGPIFKLRNSYHMDSWKVDSYLIKPDIWALLSVWSPSTHEHMAVLLCSTLQSSIHALACSGGLSIPVIVYTIRETSLIRERQPAS